MPFSHRVFCRVLESPSLSETLVWLRQQGFAVNISGGRSANDLLSCYWTDITLETGAEDAPLHLKCLRADASGLDPMKDEVADFIADVNELEESPARDQVLRWLASTRALVIVEFPAHGASPDAEAIGESVAALFVERAQGMAQRDGVGFLDEDDDVVLALG